jgi:hypothetical protein
MVSDLHAYYLIRGVLVQVVQEDAASGMSEVHLPGGFKTFWTLKRFLSRSPVKDTFGAVETPTASTMVLPGQTMPSPTPKADADALNQQHAMPMSVAEVVCRRL